ncbi:MAG: cupredoxin domain-containing protein [Chloroflexi bacterium]|nr:cupredoxin domain-containing protein [Chloroflexota bacterium]
MRTFAMSLAATGAALIVGVFIYFVYAFILPSLAEDPGGEGAAFLPILVGFIAVFGVLGAASWLWPGARRRSWFWILHVVAGILVTLMFGSQITFSLTHPADAQGFIPTVLALLGAGLAIGGGIAAFLDVRRGRETWTRSGRAGWLMTALSGLIVGAVLTSALAGSASSAGGGVTDAPTTTGVVTAENTKWLPTSLQVKNGEVLGLFVINKDGFAHTFDIPTLNISVQLPANSTTAVAIKPTAAGTLEFYCAIPGHKEAGMVGTITVQ